MMNIPLQMMVVALAGWVNEQRLAVIEYLKEENRILREQLGRKRLRFTHPVSAESSICRGVFIPPIYGARRRRFGSSPPVHERLTSFQMHYLRLG